SPYQCFSAFAGNPNLISPELLVGDGLLQPADLAGVEFPEDHVYFETVLPFKAQLTQRAWHNFQSGAARPLVAPFIEFGRTNADWLDDFALFMALKDAHGMVSWQQWPEELRLRGLAALQNARSKMEQEIGLHQFRQFLFHRQWSA